MNRKITLIYIDAGGGHRAAATALCEVIREQQRSWDIYRMADDLVRSGQLGRINFAQTWWYFPRGNPADRPAIDVWREVTGCVGDQTGLLMVAGTAATQVVVPTDTPAAV